MLLCNSKFNKPKKKTNLKQKHISSISAHLLKLFKTTMKIKRLSLQKIRTEKILCESKIIKYKHNNRGPPKLRILQ